MTDDIKPYDIEVVVNNGIVGFDDEHYGDVHLTPSDETEGYILHYDGFNDESASDFAGVLFADGVFFVNQTPDAFDVRIANSKGDLDILFDWHTDYDRTDYEPDSESVIELSAELAWMLCHAVERYYWK